MPSYEQIRLVTDAQQEGTGQFDPQRLPSVFMSKLMPFQRSGVEWAIRRCGRALIADEMGLGKTVQAIALCAYFREDWPVLVVCPSSMRLSWAQEFERWLPSLCAEQVHVVTTASKVQKKSGKVTGLNPHAAINIVSYDLLVRLAEPAVKVGTS
jgi:SWI/SNF-related matrix-associated actin-dependent regulator 1 of chromatin subfamily A